MARIPETIEKISSGKMVLNVQTVGLTREQFERLCEDNSDLRFELTARKEIVIMPPNWTKTGMRNADISTQLGVWTKADGTGIAGDSNTGFTLPNGAIRAPDASWVRRDRWNALSREEQNSFAPLCPDFVIELRSDSETLSELHEKMAEYIANGAQLGWLIDPREFKVHIYRPGHALEVLDKPDSASGDPVLPGFTLDLREIW